MSAFKHLSHEFLIVCGPADGFAYGGATEYIVDPRFREQFDIPQVCLQLVLALLCQVGASRESHADVFCFASTALLQSLVHQ